MNLSDFTLHESSTLEEVLVKIEQNHHGLMFVTNSENQVIGLVTDGDLRRWLIQSPNLNDSAAKCMNPDFVWVDQLTSRELLLKQFDRRIRAIPVLDQSGCLVDIVTKDDIPTVIEEKIYARARAPVRVSFGGGGSDLTHYFADEDGAVINTTITLYSRATLRKREDSKVNVHSKDLGQSIHCENSAEFLDVAGDFGLFQALIKTVHPDFGFDLYVDSDFPIGSGLGGSAAVSAAVLGCFNQYRRDKWSQHELAELAFQAERLHMGISGGWQDQYATVFGGFNFMEFRMDGNVVQPLRIQREILLELEESLILCDTRLSHNSGEIHDHQKSRMALPDIKEKMRSNVDLTFKMRDHLLKGGILEFGRRLHEAWVFKRQFSEKISNDNLDEVYKLAQEHGAVGGKLLGAGAGGFFLFLVPPFLKHSVIKALEDNGQRVETVKFDKHGLQSWSVRDPH